MMNCDHRRTVKLKSKTNPTNFKSHGELLFSNNDIFESFYICKFNIMHTELTLQHPLTAAAADGCK